MDYKITLKAARINAKLRQSEVAERLGVSKESVSNWENGKAAPKATTLVRLCEIYSIPIDNISLPN